MRRIITFALSGLGLALVLSAPVLAEVSAATNKNTPVRGDSTVTQKGVAAAADFGALRDIAAKPLTARELAAVKGVGIATSPFLPPPIYRR